MKIPYQQGDRVIYYGFGGQPEPGTVSSCKFIDAGYSHFVRIIIDPDRHKTPVQFIISDGTTKPLASCLALPLAVRPMITPAPASVNRASCSSPSITG